MKSILRLLDFTHDSNRENFYELIYAAYVVHLCKTVDVLMFFSRVLIRVRMLYDRRLNLFDIIFAENRISKL